MTKRINNTSRRKASKSSPVYRGRRFVLMISLLIGISVLLGRAVYLEVYQQSWLKEQSGKKQRHTVSIPPYRGVIVDRLGESLAISSPVFSVQVHPRSLLEYQVKLQKDAKQKKGEEAELAALRLRLVEEKLQKLSDILGYKEGLLKKKLEVKLKGSNFVYLEKQIEPEKAHKIEKLKIPMLSTTRKYRRFYPMTETASHVVGFTDSDDKGIEGVELAMDSSLAGREGKNRVIRDAKGNFVENIEELVEMLPGEVVELSLDHRIQYAAYKLLKAKVTQLNAKAGSVVVLDTQTGEVLAMANMPTFNPNDRKTFQPLNYRNRAVVDAFEPGSTLKPLTIAAALEARVISKDVYIETSPGKLKIGKTVVRDLKDYGTISLSKILAKSSNVGASKVALLMKPSEHWKFLSRVGFGRKPDAGFSSEISGKLSYYDKWGKVDRASRGYGYGVSVSLLQLAQAYSVFATGGVLNPVSIFKQHKQPLGQRVMAENNANAVLKMMRSVVQKNATGKNARIDGYHVAGKTGTANKFINNRYNKDKLIVSFIGMAPATNPRLVVAVMIDEPKVEKASGGRLAAPLFSKIMANSLRILDIAPDNLPELKPKLAPIFKQRDSEIAVLDIVLDKGGL